MFTLEPHITIDHGAGVDARWDPLIVTLSATPVPPVIAPAHDLGVLGGGKVTVSTTLAQYGTTWLRFTLPSSVGQSRDSFYLDIDTIGSQLSHPVAQQNNPGVWVFDSSGNLIAGGQDIDAAAGNRQEIVSFGADQRPQPIITAERTGAAGRSTKERTTSSSWRKTPRASPRTGSSHPPAARRAGRSP